VPKRKKGLGEEARSGDSLPRRPWAKPVSPGIFMVRRVLERV
jgi:hypothetical protein